MKFRVPLVPWWVRWAGVVGLAGFIFIFSLVVVPPETVVDQAKPALIPLDKWRHIVAYAAFGYALAYATTDWNTQRGTLAIIVIGTVVSYGVGIEFGQSHLPDRYFSLGDTYANALGGILVIPWYFLRPYFDFIPTTTFIKSPLKKSNR